MPNLPFGSIMDEQRAEREELPIVPYVSPDALREYLKVETRLRKNSRLSEMEACRLCEVDYDLYREIKRRAIASNHEALNEKSFHDADLIRPGRGILKGRG